MNPPALNKKVCMLGAHAVGKTSLVRQYIYSIYSEGYFTTVGVKTDKKTLRVGDQNVTMVLWDLYGEDDFQKLHVSYLRGAAGFFVVTDGTRRATLEAALAVYAKAESSYGKTPAVMALNKCDLTEQWELPQETESELAARGWKVFRTSAKTGACVEEAFGCLAGMMLAT